MKRIAIGLSAAALAIAGTAYAAHHEGRSMPDADGDGVVTRSESQAHAAAMFARMDANGDGQLDQTDRAAKRQERRAKMFEGLDADSNGSITRDEFMAFERPGKGMGKGEGGWKHRMGHRGGGHHGKMMMKMADTNNDGAVSQAEFTASAGKRFDSIDANNDGQITKEERQAHHQEMRGKWRDRTDG
jgi:Ca2+-binding EF-hand superfamily protein